MNLCHVINILICMYYFIKSGFSVIGKGNYPVNNFI
jgi:hypothetical protein